jgi:hypothetical protein
VVQKHRVHRLAHVVVAAEREGQVADAAGELGARARDLDAPRRVDECAGEVGVLFDARRDGQHVGVEDDVFGGKTGLFGEQAIGPLADRDLAIGGLRLALLVEGHDHDGGAVLLDFPGFREEIRLTLFEADGVDDALALQVLEPRLEHAPLGAVDHDGQARDLGLGREQAEEAPHRRLRVEHALVHVDVEHVGPAAHLIQRDLEGRGVVARAHEIGEALRARDVGALADHHEVGVGADREGLEARERGEPGALLGERTRRAAIHRVGDGAHVLGRGAATAADDVHVALVRELGEQRRGGLRGLVVFAERVGQTGVGETGHGRVGEGRELLHVRPHVPRAERAVDADAERLRVAHGGPEGFERLAREGAATLVDDGDAQHERRRVTASGEQLVCGDEGGLQVERVEDGLDQQRVRAAVEQAAHLLAVGLLDLNEGDRAKARIVDVGREGERAVHGPDGARDEAGFVGVLLGPGVGRFLRDARRSDVHLVDDVLQVVVGLGDARRGEGVGLDDVRARREVGVVDAADHLGPREREQVAVALEIRRVLREAVAAEVRLPQAMALDHRAHGPVEDEDSLREQLAEGDFEGASHRGSSGGSTAAQGPENAGRSASKRALTVGHAGGRVKRPHPARGSGERQIPGQIQA